MSNSGELNLPACRLGELGFALSSERAPGPPLPAPDPMDGLEAGGDIALRHQSQPCCVSSWKGNTLSVARTWHGDFAAGESAPHAIPKPLTW